MPDPIDPAALLRASYAPRPFSLSPVEASALLGAVTRLLHAPEAKPERSLSPEQLAQRTLKRETYEHLAARLSAFLDHAYGVASVEQTEPVHEPELTACPRSWVP